MNTDLGVGVCDAGGLSSSALWNCLCSGSESELCGALNLQRLDSLWSAMVSFLSRRQRLVFYKSDDIFNPVVVVF